MSGRGATPKRLSVLLQSVGSTEGRKRLTAYLENGPFPHYQPHPRKAGLIVRIDADGNRTTGRFVNRTFKPVRTSE